MNKADLIRAAAAKDEELTQGKVEKSLNAILDVISDSLIKHDPVMLIGFGTFEVRHRSARTGRNPQTGETMEVAASYNAVFKPGSRLKERLNK